MVLTERMGTGREVEGRVEKRDWEGGRGGEWRGRGKVEKRDWERESWRVERGERRKEVGRNVERIVGWRWRVEGESGERRFRREGWREKCRAAEVKVLRKYDFYRVSQRL